MHSISIRAETPVDHGAIRDLIVEVFHETFGSGEAETTVESDHDMVLELEPGLLDRTSGPVVYPEPWHGFL